MAPRNIASRPRRRVDPNALVINTIQKGQGKPRKRQFLPNFNADSDNDGRKAWRNGRQHDTEHDFQKGYNPVEDTGALESLRYIQIKTGTHFEIFKRTGSAYANVWAVKIWGAIEQTTAAKAHLASFLIDANVDGDRIRSFPKSERDRGWEQNQLIHKKLQREIKRQKFRRTLTNEERLAKKFCYAVVVPWSEEDMRAEEYLGLQLEAVDEIRMDTMSYINLERGVHGSVFMILGDNHEKMIQAARRLQSIPARTNSYTLEPAQFFLLKPMALPFDYSAFKIEQVDYCSRPDVHRQGPAAKETSAGKFLILRPTGIAHDEYLDEDLARIMSLHEIEDDGAIWLGNMHLAELNLQYLNLYITTALRNVTSHKGYLKMEANIGFCVLRRYKRGESGNETYNVDVMEEFLAGANNGLTELDAVMVGHLGNDNCRILLDQFVGSRHEFTFCDQIFPPNWTTRRCLAKCHPRLKAAFIIDQGSAGDLRLELEFKRTDGDTFERVTRRWLRLRGENKAPTVFCDVNIIDLQDPDTSYSLALSCCDELTQLQEAKLASGCIAFANEVTPNMDVALEKGKNRRLFTFPAYKRNGLVNLLRYEQYRSWLFTVSGTGYVVELYTMQESEPDPTAAAKQHAEQDLLLQEEKWGIRVFHDQWENLFKENRELGMGKVTDWEPTEAQFFPSEGCLDYKDMEGVEAEVGAGFQELMRVLKLVESIAKGHEGRKDDRKNANAGRKDSGLKYLRA